MNRFCITSLILLSAVTAFAGPITPSKLKTSPDGADKNVQQLLVDHGFSASVDTDQSAGQIFAQCDPASDMHWSILWQVAGQAPNHKLGYYTDLLAASPTVTWVVGGSSSGLGNTADLNLGSQKFGLAFYAGDGEGNVYYSQSAKNTVDNFDHMALVDLSGVGHCDFLTGWEDIKGGGDQDYNDIAIRVQGIQAVPEPGTMAALGLGVIGLIRRRRQAK